MDKQQYHKAVEVLRSEGPTTDQIAELTSILGTDISDQAQATKLKESLVGNDTMIVTNNADETVTVAFGGVAVTSQNFGLAFAATLLNVIAARAIDKFLPEPKPAGATGSRNGGMASPAGDRRLPIARGREY